MNNELTVTGNGSQPTLGKRAITVVIHVILLGIAYCTVGAYVANAATRIDPHPHFTDTPANFRLPYEEVTISPRGENLHLAAWYIPNVESSRAVILVHGKNASKQDVISGKIVELSGVFFDSDFTVLTIDLRGHGESDGNRYSYGFFERYDVLGAVDFLIEKGYEPASIGILGISMGGGAAIGAASIEPSIGALALDSTFADLNPLIEELGEKESGVPTFVLPGAFLMNRLIYGYDLTKIRPVEDLAKYAPGPVLILHCRADAIVGMWHPETLLTAVPYAEITYFDNCAHAELFRDSPEEYRAVVISFFVQNLE